MTSVDLHPEELLERAAQGELSADERERLELHLSRCDVCRVEQLVRMDFRNESQRQAENIDVQRLLSAVLSAPRYDSQRAPTHSRVRRVRVLVSAAAAMMTFAGLAAAARWSGVVAPARSTGPADTVALAPRLAHPSAPQPHVVLPPVPSPVAVEDQAVVVPEPLPLPAVPPPMKVMAARVAPLPVADPVNVAPAPDAPTLFGLANEARRAGDHAGANTLYQTLLEHYPGSAEAHESLAVRGRMLLDDGDTSSALRSFDAYLRVGGTLREDVMLGRALAVGRLGRTDDEARAWSSLVESYPSSVHAERAHRRLLELGQR
jgi:anti-sigma factor RsiW